MGSKSSSRRKSAPVPGAASECFAGLSPSTLLAMPEREYMSDQQLAYFRARLLQMRAELTSRESLELDRLSGEEQLADPADRATIEEVQSLALRLREREAQHLQKIDYALSKITNRDYGYCEKTGDPIGLRRLIARPTATVCVQVKTHDERVEIHFSKRRTA